MKRNVDKSALIVSIIGVGITLFAVWASTDNVWNSPNFDIRMENLEKNEKDKKPVDEIVRVIYDDVNFMPLNATWLRMHDDEYLRDLKERDRFSSEDLWILDRIYYNPEKDGRSQKIILTNNGFSQAHDVLVQISGNDNFKMIEYICPEIMSDDQITKEFGKYYLVSISRMSVQLPCEIIINSVGYNGIKEVIVTGDESHPRVWPNDIINDQKTNLMRLNIVLYMVIGSLAIVVINYTVQIYQKRIKNSKN